MWESRVAYKISVGKIEGRRPLERPRYRWEKILKLMLQMWVGAWTGLIRLRIGTGAGLL
jgi:hypothetical protein